MPSSVVGRRDLCGGRGVLRDDIVSLHMNGDVWSIDIESHGIQRRLRALQDFSFTF
jgi:hypothetical protein